MAISSDWRRSSSFRTPRSVGASRSWPCEAAIDRSSRAEPTLHTAAQREATMVDSKDGSAEVTQAPGEHTTLSTTRRDVIRSIGAGALGAAFAAGASPAAAQMAQGHREVRPGTPPLAGIRVIERSNLLSGRL